MKYFIILFAVLLVLVQIYSSNAVERSESSLDNDNLELLSKRRLSTPWGKRLTSSWGKRLTGTWGKRLTSTWGKRAESDSDELYQRILRELYNTARLKQLEDPRYSPDDDSDSFTLEQLIAQRHLWKDTNEN